MPPSVTGPSGAVLEPSKARRSGRGEPRRCRAPAANVARVRRTGRADALELRPACRFGRGASGLSAPASGTARRDQPAIRAASHRAEQVKTLEIEDGRVELRAATEPDYDCIFHIELVAAVQRIAGNGTGAHTRRLMGCSWTDTRSSVMKGRLHPTQKGKSHGGSRCRVAGRAISFDPRIPTPSRKIIRPSYEGGRHNLTKMSFLLHLRNTFWLLQSGGSRTTRVGTQCHLIFPQGRSRHALGIVAKTSPFQEADDPCHRKIRAASGPRAVALIAAVDRSRRPITRRRHTAIEWPFAKWIGRLNVSAMHPTKVPSCLGL